MIANMLGGQLYQFNPVPVRPFVLVTLENINEVEMKCKNQQDMWW
jgi:hypothetical protein